MTQREIRLEEPGCFIERTGELPDPAPGEARVRIRRIGVCGTDIHAFHGRQPFFEYPRVLGHELAGEIVSLNGDSELQVGQTVAIEPYLNDPESPASRRGKSNCCENLQVLGVHCDGGMRPEINVPVRKLHTSHKATVDQLALVEMLGIGRHAVNRSQAAAADSALVIGAGPIGLSVLAFLQLHTKDITVADIDERRLAFCREAFGVEKTILIQPDRDLPDIRPDIIFDATGNRKSMLSTFEYIAHGGRIVFVGLFQGEVTFDDPNFHRREVSLLSSRNATTSEFADVIASIENGRIDAGPWITHRMELFDLPTSFSETISDSSLRKAVVDVD